MESPHGNHSDQAKTSKLKKSDSSSSISSFEDFFQLEASKLMKSTTNASNHANAQLALDINDGRGNQMSNGKQFAVDATTMTQSPPNQVMEADPYRIPASVFASSKSSTPMEWSVASNESLFSIHVGNASFSRENIFLGQSGELASPTMNSPLPSSQRKTPELGEPLESLHQTEVANAETMKQVLRAAADEHGKEGSQAPDIQPPASVSRRSDGSTTSTRSFAFPILAEGRNASVRMIPEQQLLENHRQQQQEESQPQAFETIADAGRTRWFPCFTCCPFCC